MDDLIDFIIESNRIEGIHRPPTEAEIEVTQQVLSRVLIETGDLELAVDVMAPGHRMRDREGLNVRVGDHVAPTGGAKIRLRLLEVIARANAGDDPFKVHCAYETLHPFTDGNGRSGRLLWLWMMLRQGKDPYVLRRGFLHTWYYQTLSACGDLAPTQGPRP